MQCQDTIALAGRSHINVFMGGLTTQDSVLLPRSARQVSRHIESIECFWRPSFMLGGHHAEGGVVTQAPKRSPSNVDDVVLEPDVRPGGRVFSGLNTASRSLDSGSWIGARENPSRSRVALTRVRFPDPVTLVKVTWHQEKNEGAVSSGLERYRELMSFVRVCEWL